MFRITYVVIRYCAHDPVLVVPINERPNKSSINNSKLETVTCG